MNPRALLALLAVIAAGCVTETHESKRQPSLAGFDLSRQWTQPVLFHGVPVQFELAEGEQSRMLLPGHGHDLIGIHGDQSRGIEHRFDAFYLQGRRCGEIRDDVGPLMVYLPAREGRPWTRTLDGFELVWDAEPGMCAVEQRIGNRLVWTLVGATVALDPSGRVEITYGRHSRSEENTVPEGKIQVWDLEKLDSGAKSRRPRERRELLRCPVRIHLGPHGKRL